MLCIRSVIIATAVVVTFILVASSLGGLPRETDESSVIVTTNPRAHIDDGGDIREVSVTFAVLFFLGSLVAKIPSLVFQHEWIRPMEDA